MKNKMSIIVVFGLLFIISFSVLVSNLTGGEELPKLNEITYEEYASYFDETSKDLVFVYVGQPGCGACMATEPILKQLQDEEKVVFNYYDVTQLSEENRDVFIKTSKSFEEGIYTPTLIAIFNGKEVNSRVGGGSLDELRTFVVNSKDKAK